MPISKSGRPKINWTLYKGSNLDGLLDENDPNENTTVGNGRTHPQACPTVNITLFELGL